MKVQDGLIFSFLAILGVSAALYLNDFHLPDWLGSLVSGAQVVEGERQPAETPEAISPVVKNEERPPSAPKSVRRIEERAPEYVCRKKPVKAIEEINGPQIYKWVDEHGKTHFGDRRPQQNVVETVSVDARKHYFNLELHADSKNFPPYFRDRLTVRVNKAYDVLAQLISEEQLHQVDVNLWVFNSSAAYEDFYARHASGVASKSQGFHSSRFNVAAALRKTDQQVLATSVHEAVHVMNAGMFGWLPRWLNEGMAEYLENMKVYGQSADILVSKFAVQQLSKAPLNLSYVLAADFNQWQGANRSSLYAHSWALVYFLMSTSEGKSVLNRFLTSSATNPCQMLNSHEFLSHHYPGGMNALRQNFTRWADSDKLPHHI